MAQKLPRYLIIIVGLLVSLALSRNIIKISSSSKRIASSQNKLEETRNENERLKRELEKVQSEVFIERQARDKLGLAKEGEIVLVLPDEDILRRLSPRSTREEEFVLPKANWEKWLNLFL